jgi:MoxR-like ATPase
MSSVGEVIVGQDQMVRGLTLGLLCNGHVLVEGVPGLAKSLTVSTLARAIDATFARLQFTPDLLPADLVGTMIYNPREAVFTPRKGPIFTNIVLADEINRAPAKVQSALLEAMQERQVTIGDSTYALPDPFLVLATQNPIEQEGTYPLPEAQIDRFMLKVVVGYPTKAQEREIVDRMATGAPPMAPSRVMDLATLRSARAAASAVFIDSSVRDYIVDLVHATREPGEHRLELKDFVEFGASPRASIWLAIAAKAEAFLNGRDYATPHDVKTVAPQIITHRLVMSYEAEAEGLTAADAVHRILEKVPVP